MSNQFKHSLDKWYEARNQQSWALGIVYKTIGPSYRKPGAMVFINESGDQFGLLSGGCLEADIRKSALRSIALNRSTLKTYDGSDDEDLSFHLGCGGIVKILIQPITAQNSYLKLDDLHKALSDKKKGYYCIEIPNDKSLSKSEFEEGGNVQHSSQAALIEREHNQWLSIPIQPEPHLLIVGGGIDAVPVVKLAKELGWRVSLWDTRPAYGRPEHFLGVDDFLEMPYEKLSEQVIQNKIDVGLVMTHNLEMDAKCFSALNSTKIKHVGLLGPVARRQKVMNLADLTEANINLSISSPAGFDIGGELPESVALSMLAECHHKLFKENT